jgi:hypothetical protein
MNRRQIIKAMAAVPVALTAAYHGVGLAACDMLSLPVHPTQMFVRKPGSVPISEAAFKAIFGECASASLTPVVQIDMPLPLTALLDLRAQAAEIVTADFPAVEDPDISNLPPTVRA